MFRKKQIPRFARDDIKWAFFGVRLRQIGHGAGVFDKFFQGGHDGGARKKIAKEVDLAPELIVWNLLDEFFYGGQRYSVVLGDLFGRRAGAANDFALPHTLR